MDKSVVNPAQFIRDNMPSAGLFAGMEWRISPEPFALGQKMAGELESLGRVLLQFYRAVNLLYRQSVAGKEPAWIAGLLDQGKTSELIDLQRSKAFKNAVPRVIRPDLLLTDSGLKMTELDSVPGGIGLTAWLNQAYSLLDKPVLGGSDGMLDGFSKIFNESKRVVIVVSEEAASYRPEMEWICTQLNNRVTNNGEGLAPMPQFVVQDSSFDGFQQGDAVYRFFELFDLPNVANSSQVFRMAVDSTVTVTPPPKPVFEEKLLLALLWNRNLEGFWRRELGEGFLARMRQITPYSWVMDPAPLPAYGAIPELNLPNWDSLKGFSQRERELIVKISGFSPKAWGARGVCLGSDVSSLEWAVAVENALRDFPQSPHILQRYHKPSLYEVQWHDFQSKRTVAMQGRVRLCPYYFLSGENDAARAMLGGVLATICPADKKIIHGMPDAILAPCGV